MKVKIIFIIFFLIVFLFTLQSQSDLKMVLQAGNTGQVHKVVFSNDGSMFATANIMNNYVKVWSIKGRLIRLFKNDNNLSGAEMAFSPDNKYLAVTDMQTIKIWGLKDNYFRIIKNNEEAAPYRMFYSVVFSKDSKYLITATSLNVNIVLPKELEKDELEKIIKKIASRKDKEKMQSAYFQDAKTGKYKIRLDLESYSDLYTLYIESGNSLDTVNMQDFRNVVELWDIDGRYVKAIGLHNTDLQAAIRNVLISPDGKTILSYGVDNFIKLWDFQGNLLNTIQGDNPYYISNITFSSDGSLIGWAGGNGYKVCNMNGVFFVNERRQMIMPDINLNEKLYVESGTKGAAEDYYFVIRFRNFKNEIVKESEKVSNIMYIKFSPDAENVIAGGMDGAVNIINRKTGKLVTLINDDYGEWLIFTPDGYWDASRNGGKLAAMVKGMEAFSVDQFAARFNRPDIILRRIGIKDNDEINHFYNIYKKRLKKLNLNEDDSPIELHVPFAKITGVNQDNKFADISFNLSDDKYKLKTYNIYINDVPIFGAYGKNLGSQNIQLKEKLELTSGKNKIEVSCINEKGAESFRALTYLNYNSSIALNKGVGDLYFIGFGVSKYKNKSYNLKYADKDVKDLAESLSKMDRYFNQIHIKTYLNNEVTAENIKKAKSILANAKVDDTFILFIAGHGLHDIDENATYYYLTYDADVKNLSKTAANFELIEDLLQGIAPRNKLFLMDTCESGEIEDDDEKMYYTMADIEKMNARSIRGLRKVVDNKKDIAKRDFIFETDRFINNDLLRRSGAIVFSSSKGGEFSYEKDELENGLFTEAIINALESHADTNSDKMITTKELREYVIDAVSRLSNDLQHPTVDRDNIYQEFGFPVVK